MISIREREVERVKQTTNIQEEFLITDSFKLNIKVAAGHKIEAEEPRAREHRLENSKYSL